MNKKKIENAGSIRRFAAIMGFVACLGTVRAEMPDSFVEYIESDGTQYIDLGCDLTRNTRVSIDFMVTVKNGNNNMFGGYRSFAFITHDWLYVFAKRTVTTCSPGTRYRVDLDTAAQSIIIDGESKVLSGYAGNEGSAQSCGAYVFWAKNSTENKAKMRLYSCSVSTASDGKEVRKLFPCVKNGKGGLYDTVSGEIFYDATGTGNAFLLGAVVPTPPEALGSLQVAGDPSEIGTPEPAYGYHTDLKAGQTYALICPAAFTNDNASAAYRCIGWELKVGSVVTSNTAENVCRCMYTRGEESERAKVTWIWANDPSFPLTRYVTSTGAGRADGTDWENAMSSLARAYAEVGAHPAGGTVRLKGGFYTTAKGNLTSTAIGLCDNVTVVGGEDGKATVISGDTNFDDAWEADGKHPIWTDNGDGTYTYNPPPQGYYRQSYSKTRDTIDTLFTKTGEANCTNRFENLTFNGFNRFFYCTSGQADGYVFKNCRFLASGGGGNKQYSCLDFVGANLSLEDCVFEGNLNVVRSAGGTASKVIVRNCVFNSNEGGWYGPHAGGLRLEGATAAEVTGCTFSWLWTGGSCIAASAIDVSAGTQPVVISNCVFRKNSVSNSNAHGVVAVVTSGAVEIHSSRVEDSVGVNISSGVCVKGTPSRVSVAGCYFAGNAISNLTTRSVDTAAALAVNAENTPTEVVNCTFERNMSVGTSEMGSSWCRVLSLGTRRGCVVNCLFNDNTCGFVDADGHLTRTGDVGPTLGLKAPDTCLFLNNAFANSEHATVPLCVSYNKGRCSALHCVAEGAGEETWVEYCSTDLGFAQEPLFMDAIQLSAPSTNGVVVARGLGGRNSRKVRKMGRLVVRASDGYLYYYDTGKLYESHGKHWHRCCDLNADAALTDEEASAFGLSLDATPIQDAFGQTRVTGQIAPGPINDQSICPGLILYLK